MKRDISARPLVRGVLTLLLAVVALFGTPIFFVAALFTGPDDKGGGAITHLFVLLCFLSGLTAYAVGRGRSWAHGVVAALGIGVAITALLVPWLDKGDNPVALKVWMIVVGMTFAATLYLALRYAISKPPAATISDSETPT